MKTESPIRHLTYLLMIAVLFSSARGVAQEMIPFRTVMQSAHAEPAQPAKADATGPLSQSVISKHARSSKAERVTGGVLLGTGVAVITVTLVIVGALHGSAGHDGRVWAGIGGGAAMTGAGVSLIVLGSHKKSSN